MRLHTAFTAGLLLIAGMNCNILAQSIYTCVDGKGRKITSDRSIPECIDRMQQELTYSGLVKRQVKPSPTFAELAEQEQISKLADEARLREADEKRRNRALLLRYPTRTVHDKERALAIAHVEKININSDLEMLELIKQRKAINIEMEFYAKDPGKAPLALQRQQHNNERNRAAQQKLSAHQQDQEKKRINLRFDEELVKLKPLWGSAS